MELGKWLVAGGLVLNIAGTVCIGWVVPRHTRQTVFEDPLRWVDLKAQTVKAERTRPGAIGWTLGWMLLALGFVLQLVGTGLWT